MFMCKCTNSCLHIMYSMHKYIYKFLMYETFVKVQPHAKNGDNNICCIGQCQN